MYKGKRTCKILKEIRAQIAAENDIAFVTSECKHQGDCAGTCPKCEAEVRYLEKELEKRIRLSKAVTVAGLAAAITATSISATSCDAFRPTGGEPTESYVDITDSRNVKLSTFTPNYVANLPKAARTLQLQEVMEIKDTKNSDRWRILTFWEDYFACFEDNTDYYRLYHPDDQDVGETRKSRLLAVTYTDDGAVAEVTVTKKNHQARALRSPNELTFASKSSATSCLLLELTARQMGYKNEELRAQLQDWWKDDYLGTHEWVKSMDLYRRKDGSVLWLYFHPTGIATLSDLGTGSVEENTNYKYWLLRSITPQTLADQLSKQNVVNWLNTSCGQGNARTAIAGVWCFDRSNYFSNGDFFIRADSTQLQHYSLTPITEQMRKKGISVDALAFRFDEQGNIVSITPEQISTSMENVPILPPEDYFTIASGWHTVETMLLRIVNQSPQPYPETAARLRSVWKDALQERIIATWDPETSYYYLFTVAGVSEKFWLLFDSNTEKLIGAYARDPFGPTAGEPPYDPWHGTPRDE